MNKTLNFNTYTGKYTFASCFFAVISSLAFIVSIWYVWKIAGCIIFEQETENIIHFGKLAIVFMMMSIIIYVSCLFCSHKAAFKTSSDIRIKLLNHISSSSSSIPSTILDASGTIEKYLAHQLPDKYAALSSAIGFTCLLFYADWRLALVSLAPIIFGFVVMALMTGEAMRARTAEYKKALNIFSNETAEYVRNIKSISSFKRFQKSVENYEAWTIAYAQALRPAMMCFTLALNGAFAFLIAAGVFTAFYFGISHEFLNSFILAVITAPLISINLTRTIRHNENKVLVSNSMRSINEFLKNIEMSKKGAIS